MKISQKKLVKIIFNFFYINKENKEKSQYLNFKLLINPGLIKRILSQTSNNYNFSLIKILINLLITSINEILHNIAQTHPYKN